MSNSKRVLIIHHLESTWESGYRRKGESFESLGAKIITHAQAEQYDEVILTQFDGISPNSEHLEYICLPDFCDVDFDEEDEDSQFASVSDVVDTWEEYAYGWELSHALEEGNEIDNLDDFPPIYEDAWGGKWARGGNHSDIVLLPEWMFNLKGLDVSICGAFDGECVEDLEIALEACGVEFNRIESLII